MSNLHTLFASRVFVATITKIAQFNKGMGKISSVWCNGVSLLGDELFKIFKNFELKIFDCGMFASEYKQVL
jgi:hypothetical protein